MGIPLILNKTEPTVEENVHYIPCTINHNGPANVSTYLQEKTDDAGMKLASFRGRPMVGLQLQLPQGFTGYVINKDVDCFEEDKQFSVQKVFHKFTFWNLDRTPTNDDTFLSALDWIDISKAIHSTESSNNAEPPN